MIVPTSADLTVVASSTGTTYITWSWDTGTNLSEMRIDGRLMCGYETTNTSINVVDITPNTCHTIDLISNLSEYGNDTACVAATNMT